MFEAAGAERAQFLLGKANYEATLFPQAEESFLEVLRLNPKFPGVHLELGKVYISLRRTDDAIRELELVLKENPGDADASYFLGGLLAQDGPLHGGDSLPREGAKGEARLLGALFLFGEGQTQAGAAGGGRGAAAEGGEVEPRRGVGLLPARTGAARLADGRWKPARRSNGSRELRAAAQDATTLDDGKVAGAR